MKTLTAPARRGFTLIELMVVIVIIAILIAFISPAVMSSMRSARIAVVKQEISGLDDACAKFKQANGIYPPSTMVLCEQPSDWATYPQYKAQIRRIWPNFNFQLTQDLNGDGDTTDIHILAGSECLVFFLGGIVTRDVVPNTRRFGPTGFSKNPQNPFVSGTGNRDFLFEFDVGRLVDLNNNGFPEYKDSLPGQQAVYIYFSSYDGEGYQQGPKAAPTDPWLGIDNALVGNSGFPAMYMARAYYSTSSPALTASTTTAQLDALNNLPTGWVPYKPQSVQIISPGYDGRPGYGGLYNPQGFTGPSARPNASGPLPSLGATPEDRSGERDNITNFHSGPLAP